MPATKTNRYAGMSYFDLLNEAEKPIADRRELPLGRNQKGIMRRHHLVEHVIDQLKAAHRDGDPFPNPHNFGCYYLIWETFKALGLNRNHNFERFTAKFKELAGDPATKNAEGKTFWQVFRDRPQRSEKGRDWEGRLLQNIEVMQRLGGKNPYGLKINQVAQDVLRRRGACIDITRESAKSPIMVKLNLEPVRFRTFTVGKGDEAETIRVAIPTNELKSRRRSIPEDQVVTVRVRAKAKRVSPRAEAAVETVVNATTTDQPEPVAGPAVESGTAPVTQALAASAE